MDQGLEGRTAIVTGGSRGIGRAICQRLGEAGANVAINYVRSEHSAEEVGQLFAGMKQWQEAHPLQEAAEWSAQRITLQQGVLP